MRSWTEAVAYGMASGSRLDTARADGAAPSAPPAVERALLRETLTRWFERRAPRRVRFVEDPDPPIEEDELYDGYTVNYEARFEPDTLELARVEVWGAIQGTIGVGFEKRDRMAKRLGVRCYQPHVFVGGTEPCGITLSELIVFLDAVAEGQIGALIDVWPWLGLTSARAVAPATLLETLQRRDDPWSYWLKARPPREVRGLKRLLDFARWQ